MKIAIGIPSPDRITPDFAIGNLGDILNYTAKKMPDVEIAISYQTGVRTDKNRNEMLNKFLPAKFDYILWLDADMLYPESIIEDYLQVVRDGKQLDVIGCLYFSRSYPFHPIAYTANKDDAIKPFTTIPPVLIKPGKIYPVDGLGFGGMMVSTKVYESLGDNKWHNYGKNFHLPGYDNPDGLTHDLEFCKVVKEAGFSILLHGSVRPSHIADYPVDESDFMREYKPIMKHNPKVIVVMPTKPEDMEKAQKSARIMKARAGIPCEVMIMEDTEKKGYAYQLNKCFKETDADLYVWSAADAFVCNDWLKHAVMEQAKQNVGLVALNNGRWNGILPAFGLVARQWIKDIYGGDIFYHKYFGHYCDTELGQIAKQLGQYAYAEKSIMLEVDYEKQFNGKTNKDDKSLFARRKKKGFSGWVTNQQLLEEFS